MKKSVSIIMATLFLATASVALFGQAAASPEKLASGTYVVYAISPQVWRVTVDSKTMANATVGGHFAITAGTPKDIEVLVMSEAEMTKFRDDATRATAKPIYTSGRKTEGDVSVKLADSGNYYVVFSNMFAYEGNKTLTADFKLTFDKK